MYVVHTKDTETDLYALFRVEALDAANECHHLLEERAITGVMISLDSYLPEITLAFAGR
jgi:hypothetical protein